MSREVCKKCGKEKPIIVWCDLCRDFHESINDIQRNDLCECNEEEDNEC